MTAFAVGSALSAPLANPERDYAVYFSNGSSTLNAGAKGWIAAAARLDTAQNPSQPVRLAVANGQSEADATLSQARLSVVRAELIADGIAIQNITVIGMGDIDRSSILNAESVYTSSGRVEIIVPYPLAD